ncbi:MAG: hypothetical protein KA004_05140 [Verrucomicrobiales bacterium]|nr:hypothetical protein [Verrucomicrobiales bacterium]
MRLVKRKIMRLPVSKLSELLVAAVTQLRDAQCALSKGCIADVDLVDDEFTVAVELVADDGWNAIVRESTQVSGEQTTLEERPEITETTQKDAAETVVIEQSAVITRTEIRTSESSVQQRSENPVTRISRKIEDGSVIEDVAQHETKQDSGRVNNGGDVVRQDYEVEAT